MTRDTGHHHASDGSESEGRGPQPLAETGRVEAFSDGVLAIVITLLVLELHPPTRAGEVLHDLAHQWPGYVAYLASFAYVAVIWVNHHELFTRIARVDSGLLWRNLLLLLTTSFLPFPTAVLSSAFQNGTRQDQAAGLVFYCMVAGAMAASWMVVFHYLSHRGHLLVTTTSARFFAAERGRAIAGIAVYCLAASTAAWWPRLGLFLTACVPFFYGLTSHGWTRSDRSRLRQKARR